MNFNILNINEVINIKEVKKFFFINNLKFYKEFNLENKIYYPFILNHNNTNYLYFRENSNIELTKRFIINDDLSVLLDKSFSNNLYKASHNLNLFKHENKIYGIGGQHCSQLLRKYYLEFNAKFFRKKYFILSKDYNITYKGYERIFNPSIKNKLHANGLHLFELKKNKIININDNLPIISGIKAGRCDLAYGEHHYDENKNFEGGLSVFDSISSIIYNNSEKKFYLYLRSNLSRGVRFIQYSTSDDLINWSDLQRITINGKNIMLNYSFYNPNFFEQEGIINKIGILNENIRKIINKPKSISFFSNLKVIISNDFKNWIELGNIGKLIYHNEWLVNNSPLKKNNCFYFYIMNNLENKLKVLYLDNECYSYFYSDRPLLINFNKKKIKEKIYIKYKLEKEGYINCRLKKLKNDENIIYSFDNFNKITYNNDNINETELVWNIPIENSIYYIDIEIFKCKLIGIS